MCKTGHVCDHDKRKLLGFSILFPPDGLSFKKNKKNQLLLDLLKQAGKQCKCTGVPQMDIKDIWQTTTCYHVCTHVVFKLNSRPYRQGQLN